ncbi:MAG: hypothetical protein ACK5JH_13500 [Anaerocolumna sp.]
MFEVKSKNWDLAKRNGKVTLKPKDMKKENNMYLSESKAKHRNKKVKGVFL